MGLECIFTWTVALIVNGHDRHWLRGELDCAKLDAGLPSTTTSIGIHPVSSTCLVDVGLVHSVTTHTSHVSVTVGDHCPTIGVETWNFSVASGDGVKPRHAFEPRGFGRLTSSPFVTTFPSIQFTSLLYPAGCIYLGVHDGKAFPKRFSFDTDNKASVQYMGSMEVNEFTSLPIRVSVMDGECSWMDMANIYREFAATTDWFQAGLARKANRPSWIADTPMWVNTHWQENDVLEVSGGAPATVVERMHALRRVTGDDIPILLHWYEWDLLGYTDSNYTDCGSGKLCGFDSHYPDYFPARDGFTKAVSELASDGVYTVPYINGRIYDQGAQGWNEGDVQESACRRKSGGFVTEDYGNGVKFAVMCPTTVVWQDTIRHVSAEVLATTRHVGGIYIDQIAAADPVHCHNKNHSHVPGGGSSWTSGYNQMLAGVRTAVGQDRLILTESNVEQLIGSVDTFLTLVGYEGDLDEVVPAFQYVYPNGVFVSAGAEFFQTDLTDNNGTNFVKKLMKQFMFGSQLGWFALGGRSNQVPSMNILELILQDQYAPLADAMMGLVKARMDSVTLHYFNDGGLASEIGSQGYVWSGGNGALAVLCNPDANLVSIPVDIDLSAVIKASRVDVYHYTDGKWKKFATDVRPSNLSTTIHVNGRTCALFEITPATYVSKTVEILVS